MPSFSCVAQQCLLLRLPTYSNMAFYLGWELSILILNRQLLIVIKADQIYHLYCIIIVIGECWFCVMFEYLRFQLRFGRQAGVDDDSDSSDGQSELFMFDNRRRQRPRTPQPPDNPDTSVLDKSKSCIVLIFVCLDLNYLKLFILFV